MMTIGHSTLTLEAFLRALGENGCTTLVDVRRFPGSRRHPHFSQERLFASLKDAEIRAVWREGLGGARGEEGQREYGVEERELSRVCGLYADGALCAGDRVADGAGGLRFGGGDVRGGGAVEGATGR
jgi:uncharacterized protein (DUF488 family)